MDAEPQASAAKQVQHDELGQNPPRPTHIPSSNRPPATLKQRHDLGCHMEYQFGPLARRSG